VARRNRKKPKKGELGGQTAAITKWIRTINQKRDSETAIAAAKNGKTKRNENREERRSRRTQNEKGIINQ
jgi:hypothetical protein